MDTNLCEDTSQSEVQSKSGKVGTPKSHKEMLLYYKPEEITLELLDSLFPDVGKHTFIPAWMLNRDIMVKPKKKA